MPILTPDQLPISVYHSSAPAWLSKTSIMDYIVHGPAWWNLAYIQRQPVRSTPDGVLQGNMLDCYLTEGEEAYRARFVAVPEDAPKRPTKAQRNAKKPSPETVDAIAYWEQFEGMTVVDRADETILYEAVAAVRVLDCWPRVQAARAQLSLRRQSSLGFGLQSRPDWMLAEGQEVTTWDLKKTRSLANFGKQAIDLGYHLQAAIASWCMAGDDLQHAEANLIAVEWERGARAREFAIPSEALADGYRRCEVAAMEIAERMKRGDWTDGVTARAPLPIPEWMARRMEAA